MLAERDDDLAVRFGRRRHLRPRPSMDPTHADDRPSRRHPALVAVRSLLLVPLPPQGTRIIDIVFLFAAIPVVLVLCLPILLVTIVSGMPIGFALSELGAPEALRTAYGLGVFVGGLVVCFFAVLLAYRRLPAAIRSLVGSDDEDSSPPA
jgi:hypothetical protein